MMMKGVIRTLYLEQESTQTKIFPIYAMKGDIFSHYCTVTDHCLLKRLFGDKMVEFFIFGLIKMDGSWKGSISYYLVDKIKFKFSNI